MSDATLDFHALAEAVRRKRRLPVSTYRLQLHGKFPFQAAADVVPYLAKLGVTDCYCSPYLQARPGSTHGYDITDHNALNVELGTAADYEALVRRLAEHGLGQVLDFVPNHMGVDPVTNLWWRDVLENGPSSPYARYFDVDWDPIKPELKGKVLLPILGDYYGKVLERGELKLAFDKGGFVLRYFQQELPIDPATFPSILRSEGVALSGLNVEDPTYQEFLSVLTALEHLPPAVKPTPERVAERQREKKVARERLGKLTEGVAPVREHIERALAAFNGTPGQPESFDKLHELLEKQRYRLAYWKTAIHEINYRRFFDINDLAGVRMEESAVFTATHGLVLRLVREGKITGLRLDHLDGLFDPLGYLEQLQEAVLCEWAGELNPALTGDALRQAVRGWRDEQRRQTPGSLAERPFYVVAEKILSGNETLPPGWPIMGTSGYDFLNDLNRLFVDPQSMKPLRTFYQKFTGRDEVLADLVYRCKQLITDTSMASELNVLAFALNRISEGDRRLRDFTLASLRDALAEVVACFPVYRTYVNAAGAADVDRQEIEVALTRARLRNPALEPSVFDFIRAALLPPADQLGADEHKRRLNFAMKFQQYTGPVQAKGLEDTAFYRYNVLLSLNEVGGDPQRFGAPPAQFHESNRRRQTTWPHAMLGTATHDTKRGEDARARLNVLSEIPVDWRKAVTRWAKLNAGLRTKIDGEPAPDRNDEYLFYQALVGAWSTNATPQAAPELVARLKEYMTKAIKEAKVHTSWINPNNAYDAALGKFIDGALTGPKSERFLADFLPLQQRIAVAGMVNSLAQVALKIAAPGAPDFYQGTELWDLSLVDPDNRRPIDYDVRRKLLDEMEPLLDLQAPLSGPDREARLRGLLENWHDGRIKLLVTACGLRLRKQKPAAFLDGAYLPLTAEGAAADHVVAIARRHDSDHAIVVTPRLTAKLVSPERPLPVGPETWQDTKVHLPEEARAAAYRNLLTGEVVQASDGSLPLAAVLRFCPVAFLTPA